LARTKLIKIKSDSLINLISDTVTKPNPAMIEAMMHAEVGDDVFKADPSVNKLQSTLAQMFEMDAGLFCPSGTMTNQIAIKMHTNPMDELICEKLSHVYKYENGGYAYNSGIALKLIEGKHGKIMPEQLDDIVNPDYDWLPTSKLVCIENSCNAGGGSYYTLDEIQAISKKTKELGLLLHLDGARLFNVLAETNESTSAIGKCFDSISICFSKGLGAPVGSILLGKERFIKKARKIRKAMGGGMRQAGYLASACQYAVENNVQRLKTDNDRAKELGIVLADCSFVKKVIPVHTNILIFDLRDDLYSEGFLQKLTEKGILASAFGPQKIRFVTHLDISEDNMLEVKKVLKQMSYEYIN